MKLLTRHTKIQNTYDIKILKDCTKKKATYEEMGNFDKAVETRKKNHTEIIEMKNIISEINSLYELSSRLESRGNQAPLTGLGIISNNPMCKWCPRNKRRDNMTEEITEVLLAKTYQN